MSDLISCKLCYSMYQRRLELKTFCLLQDLLFNVHGAFQICQEGCKHYVTDSTSGRVYRTSWILESCKQERIKTFYQSAIYKPDLSFFCTHENWSYTEKEQISIYQNEHFTCSKQP